MKNIAVLSFAFCLTAAALSGCSASTATVATHPMQSSSMMGPKQEQIGDDANSEKEDSTAEKKQGDLASSSKTALTGEQAIPSPKSPAFEYPDAVRGIYVTAHSAGGERFAKLLNLVDSTDLNTMVIDVKDDNGTITFKIDGDLGDSSQSIIKDPKAMMQTLAEHKIYPIARIVTFKDTNLAVKHPEWSFQENGGIWKNGKGDAFVNPFLKDVWDYNIRVAQEAAKLGFKEIQFDYVRFPEGFEKRDKTLVYSMGDYSKEKLEPKLLAEWEKNEEEWKKKESTTSAAANLAEGSETKAVPAMASVQSANDPSTLKEPQKPVYDAVTARIQAVTDFVAYAKKALDPLGVKVSVDIFGYTATLPEAPGIGQNFSYISNNVDVISSMIYPSHWGPGYFNISKPDKEPYRLVQEYEKTEHEKMAKLNHAPVSRPWIQDFTASWLGKGNYISYGKAEVEAQIKALNEAGVKEFLVWNASNNYTDGVDYTP